MEGWREVYREGCSEGWGVLTTPAKYSSHDCIAKRKTYLLEEEKNYILVDVQSLNIIIHCFG